MAEIQDERQEYVNSIYDYAANLFINEKMSEKKVKKNLVEQGLDEESALIVIENLKKQIIDAQKEKSKKNMQYGALWCIGGLLVTAISYFEAGSGGSYMFAWGAIIFGAIQFLRGLTNS